MRFIQHFPPEQEASLRIRGIHPVEFDFSTLKEFLNNEHIRYYTSDINFKRFTICRDAEYELISELKDGKTFKLGVLDGNITEIPEWRPKHESIDDVHRAS